MRSTEREDDERYRSASSAHASHCRQLSLELRLCRFKRGHAVICAKALRLAGEVQRPKLP